MKEWMTILEVQRSLASDLAEQLSLAQERSPLSPEFADRIREAIARQRQIALKLRDSAVAAKERAIENTADENLALWSEVLAIIADTGSSTSENL